MGQWIDWNGRRREVVKVKSDNPDHAGYFTTFRDMMLPGQVEYEPDPGYKDPLSDPWWVKDRIAETPSKKRGKNK